MLIVTLAFLYYLIEPVCNGDCWSKAELDEIEKAMDICLKGGRKGKFTGMKQRAFFCNPKGPEYNTGLYAKCLADNMKKKPKNWEPEAVKHWQGEITKGVKPKCDDKSWGKDKKGKTLRMTYYDNLYWLNSAIDFDPNFKRSEFMEECIGPKFLEMQVGEYYCKMDKEKKIEKGHCNETNLAQFKDCMIKKTPPLANYWDTEFKELLTMAKLLCNPNPKKKEELEPMEKFIVKPSNTLKTMTLPFDCYFNGHVLKFDPMEDGSIRPRCFKKGVGGK